VAALMRPKANKKSKKRTAITCLFVDIGGVLLSDGWGHKSRQLAASTFDLNTEEMESRHQQVFEIYELGRIDLEEYLKRVVFYQRRKFTPDQFREFMFVQSRPYPQMIGLLGNLKAKYGVKIVVVSNEGRELNAYRIRKFNLDGFVDAFISSCFVHLRKPDADIFRLALDIAQVPLEQAVYIENTPMFVEVAESLGIRSILHDNHESTTAKLSAVGLNTIE
jgi:putative hydrolase of the HAD superfamily